MRTEVRKSLGHGFLLSEQEVRRFADTMNQLFERVAPNREPVVDIQVKLRSGEVTDCTSIDEVFSLNNSRSNPVVRLTVNQREREKKPEFELSLEFLDPSVEKEQSGSVRYRITGKDRGWILIATSLIEEGIKRVKTFAWRELFAGRFMPIFFLATMILVMAPMVLSDRFSSDPQKAAVEKLESAWRKGQVKDPVEAIIILAKDRQAAEAPWAGLKPVVVGFALVVVLILAVSGMAYLFPSYNFLWGEYVFVYQRRQTVRTYLLWVVATGLAVSILAGIIVRRL